MPMPARGEECAENVPARGAVVAWNPVTESIFGDPLKIVRYEVIIEDEISLNFDVKFPALDRHDVERTAGASAAGQGIHRRSPGG